MLAASEMTMKQGPSFHCGRGGARAGQWGDVIKYDSPVRRRIAAVRVRRYEAKTDVPWEHCGESQVHTSPARRLRKWHLYGEREFHAMPRITTCYTITQQAASFIMVKKYSLGMSHPLHISQG